MTFWLFVTAFFNNKEIVLQAVKNKYKEKDCYMCSTKLPEEGCVIRIEGNELK